MVEHVRARGRSETRTQWRVHSMIASTVLVPLPNVYTCIVYGKSKDVMEQEEKPSQYTYTHITYTCTNSVPA